MSGDTVQGVIRVAIASRITLIPMMDIIIHLQPPIQMAIVAGNIQMVSGSILVLKRHWKARAYITSAACCFMQQAFLHRQ